jgi:hypothetical protein
LSAYADALGAGFLVFKLVPEITDNPCLAEKKYPVLIHLFSRSHA